jgi:hypothetical protein
LASAAEAVAGNKGFIAALKRCATQNQVQEVTGVSVSDGCGAMRRAESSHLIAQTQRSFCLTADEHFCSDECHLEC